MSKTIRIKFFRSQADSIARYGRTFNARLDALVGGAGNWNLTPGHGRAKIVNSRAWVERFETGPEITDLLLPQVAPLISALASLITAWFAGRPRGSKESREIEITIGTNTYKGRVRDAKQLRAIVKLLHDAGRSR